MVNISAIIEGYKNFVFQSKEHEELAQVRAEICSSCHEANPEYKFKKFIPEAVEKKERIQEILGLGCNRCGCLLSAKVRQHLQSCPLDKW